MKPMASTDSEDLEIRLRLSAQRALCGRVPIALRAVSTEAQGSVVRIRFVLDSDASEDDRELLSSAAAEIIAAFPASFALEQEFHAAPPPAPMEHLLYLVFQRCDREAPCAPPLEKERSKTADPIRANVEFGLNLFNARRMVSIPLRDALYSFQAAGEFIAFFHQPEKWRSIEDVEGFIGTRNSRGLGVLCEIYYKRFRDIWPPDVERALNRGELDRSSGVRTEPRGVSHRASRRPLIVPGRCAPPSLKGKYVVLAGLLPDRVDAELELERFVGEVGRLGATVVATLIQRRGVSRADRPGGAAAAHAGRPLRGSTYIGRGKARELQQICSRASVDLVIFYNKLSSSQRDRLEKCAGTSVVDRLQLGIVDNEEAG